MTAPEKIEGKQNKTEAYGEEEVLEKGVTLLLKSA